MQKSRLCGILTRSHVLHKLIPAVIVQILLLHRVHRRDLTEGGGKQGGIGMLNSQRGAHEGKNAPHERRRFRLHIHDNFGSQHRLLCFYFGNVSSVSFGPLHIGRRRGKSHVSSTLIPGFPLNDRQMHILIEFSRLHGIQNHCRFMHQGRTLGYELQHLWRDPCFGQVMSMQCTSPLCFDHTGAQSRNPGDALVPCAQGNGDVPAALHRTCQDMLDHRVLIQLEKCYRSHRIFRSCRVNIAGPNLYGSRPHSRILQGQRLLFRTASERVIHHLMCHFGLGGVR
mmetsp:Transcript_2711/g.5791  ORF Transcript_2711/g.5791 Transcript_2711/m.5791 type:complete len:283 (-) Transcript_2711:2470-3318(-)